MNFSIKLNGLLKTFLNQNSSDRSKKADLNTLLSLFFRFSSILLSFILVPLTIDYIKPDIYGVWITLSSLVGWIAMFDIGIGNGLKNKLSESLASENYHKGRKLISTAYIIIALVAFFLICLFLFLSQFINWQFVFNSKFISEQKLDNVVSLVSILFLLKFVSDIINVVSASFQMVSISSIFLFLSNLGTTLSVWILSKTTTPDIVLLSFFLSFFPLLISVIGSVVLFNGIFKKVKPSFKYVDFKESKGLLSLGTQFFLLQIVSLIIFQTDNLLIAQFFGAKEVTQFNLSYKYYSIVSIAFSVILSPYWTAFSDSYHKNEFLWIKTTMNKLIVYWIISIISLCLLFIASDFIMKIWIGDIIEFPVNLSLSICAYVAILNWNSILGNFLNGVGKVKIQILVAVFMGAINFPLVFLFVCQFKMGTYSIPLSNFISLTSGAIICFIQYKKIVNKKAVGIWNK